MSAERMIFQLCVVVDDVERASGHWAGLLKRPKAKTEVLFPEGILHYTRGERVDYTDCQVAKYDLGNLVLELK